MSMIKNPIIPGMAPDPSIIRVDDDYYIATSTFHWNPGIQIFHSKDLSHWKLITYGLKNQGIDLRGTDTPAGIWAPHLSYDKQNKKFWLVYSNMVNMSGREFNADSYIMSADSILGPWSKPKYLTSIGFDPSIFHDQDGKHYLSILEWETRTGYQAPGHIVIAEIDLDKGKVISNWHRVTTGFTSRGCAEAPQIYRHNDYYYLMIAAGGTGYAHGVEIGRSKAVFGPYQPHPTGEPIITSSPHHLFSLGDPDAGHFEMYNPHSAMQKAGHGSLVQTQSGEWYIAHLMSRPLPGTKLNPLGRETALQQVQWTDDDWLQMADGSNLAKEEVAGPAGLASEPQTESTFDIEERFTKSKYDMRFMTPYRVQDEQWVNTVAHRGYLRIYGNNSFFSKRNPAIMATRATSFNYSVVTRLSFEPDHYSETAGLGLYYDANNWLYVHLCLADGETRKVIRILQAKRGERMVYPFEEVTIPKGEVSLKIEYSFGQAAIFYRFSDQQNWQPITQQFDVQYLSDEGVNGAPGEIGGFTGLFNFIGAVDAHQHDSYADFSYYLVRNQV